MSQGCMQGHPFRGALSVPYTGCKGIFFIKILIWFLNWHKIIIIFRWIRQRWSKYTNSSVIRQKGESQNGCFKETKHSKFFEKWTFLTPWYAYQGLRNVCFSENLACFLLLKHPFWDSLFCLINDQFLVKICWA